MFVSSMAFNARVSDPAIGGTYMTLLNTFANLGGVWTTSTALWFVDVLTWKSCVGAKSTGFSCNSKLNEQVCRIHSFCIKLVSLEKNCNNYIGREFHLDRLYC